MNTLSKNNSIILTWILSYIDIHGNERADKAGKKKAALLADISNIKIPHTDLKPIINKFILKKWQKSWDNQTQNNLHHIQDMICKRPTGYRRDRKVILSRLQIGHTHITHSHLFKKKKKSSTLICSMYKVFLTVNWIILNCDSFKLTHPPKILPDKQPKWPFQKHQTRGHCKFSFQKNPKNIFTKV